MASAKDFLENCDACGGNWTNMLASGIKRLWPEEYDKLPDTFEFIDVIAVLKAKGIDLTNLVK